MIDYRSYSVEDLATDEMFRRWVLNPTSEITSFWNRWINENPDKGELIGLARELVLSVQETYQDELTEEMLRYEISEITRLAEERRDRRRLRSYLPAIWKAAAAILLVSGLGVGYYLSEYQHHSEVSLEKPAVENMMETRSNKSGGEMTILLSDNSVATLADGSSISFPKDFAVNERRVYLKGEAFFDVSKNENQPFFVYTNETVTKVLGTSFRIKAFDEENTVLVAVKTGRVSVFPKSKYEDKNTAGNSEKAGIILSPNQQAVFIRNENRLEKGKVLRPEILAESITQRAQLFEDKPVIEVIQALERMYRIKIQYKPDLLAQCRISAQFDDENLKQRLNAICQAIGATYDMEEGQILITSAGCN